MAKNITKTVEKCMFSKINLIILLSLTIINCGGGGGDNSSSPSINKGVFLDSAVSGLTYKTTTQKGVTNSRGEFNYIAGEVVEFYIGHMKLGEAIGDKIIYPENIDKESTSNNGVAIAMMLQTLDENNNPDDGINLSHIPIHRTVGKKVVFDHNQVDTIQTLVNDLRDDNTRPVVSKDKAQNHINQTKKNITPPVISLNGSNLISIIQGSSFTDPGASANDDRDGSVAVSVSGSVDVNIVGDYTLTYSAQDSAGNQASKNRTVRVILAVDTSAPIINLNGTNPMYIIQGSSFTDPGAIANDDIDGSVIVSVSGSVDVSTLGSYILTYSAQDSAGNQAVSKSRTVRVILAPDTTPPVISLNGSNLISIIQGSSFTDPGASANDNRDGSVTVSVSGSVDVNIVGDYTLTYSAQDSAGNQASKNRTVRVDLTADTTAPVISLNGSNTISITQDSSFTDPGASANDDRDGSVAVSVSGSVDVNIVGDYTLTYSAQDSAGNQAVSKSRTVRVILAPDTTPPVISLNGGNLISIVQGSSFTDPGASANDNRDGSVTVSVSGSVDVNIVGNYTLTYSAQDSAGNQASKNRTVRVDLAADTTAPVISLNGSNTISIIQGSSFTDPGASANDDRDGSIAVSVSGSIDVNTVGDYTLTYSAQDSAGNQATSVQRIVEVTKYEIQNSEIGAYIVVSENGFYIKWHNDDYLYKVLVYNETATLIGGNHDLESAEVSYVKFNLTGDEILVVSPFGRHKDTDQLIFTPDFSIDLTTLPVPEAIKIRPKITLNGDNPLYVVKNETFTDPGATAFDIADGVVTVTVSGSVDTTTLGDYTLYYTAQDSDAHRTIKKRTVKVVNRAPNPTAPKDSPDHLWLQGDFTDTDGDGMTDVAEIKYGFDPNDASSFPQEPELVEPTTIAIAGSEIGAYIAPYVINGFNIRWSNLQNTTFSLSLYNGAQTLYYGGHHAEYAQVNYSEFNLKGDETLTGRFTEYDRTTNQFVSSKANFSIDLSQINFTTVGAASNKISYTFEGFSEQEKTPYTNFLRRVWPIMYERLGPPAESFNTVILNQGVDSNVFVTVENGRKFLTDGDFIPRLMVHEFIHAWKGQFTITSDANWNYDPMLSGFEEGSAEGMAFEIIHEYVRSYPTDFATQKLFSYRPFQYQARYTNHLDTIRHQRNTGAGDFWTHNGSESYKYPIASVTVQTITKEYPNFYKDMMQKIYDAINNDDTWRLSRQKIVDIWKSVAPTVQGIALDKYLNSMPVFNGKKLDEGMYVLNSIRHYGTAGSQQFVTTYALNDGDTYWGILKSEVNSYNLPSWIKYDDGDDAYVYIDTQDQPFTVEIFKPNNNESSNEYYFSTDYERRSDGTANGFGWDTQSDLAMQNFPLGLYRETVTFDNYIAYDDGASEEFYFFGYDGITQFSKDDFVIMVGIDAPISGTVTINIQQNDYTQTITNSAAIFNLTPLALDTEGVFDISVFNGVDTCNYKRTLIESGTLYGYKQYGYVIKDQDFNCIEDWYESTSTNTLSAMKSKSINSNTANNPPKTYDSRRCASDIEDLPARVDVPQDIDNQLNHYGSENYKGCNSNDLLNHSTKYSN